jgi:hypothetical protein
MSNRIAVTIGVLVLAAASTVAAQPAAFDHTYAAYGAVLAGYVSNGRVNYATLKAERAALDRVVTAFGAVTKADEGAWSRPQRLAYWINAYNLFTLRAIVDHYPIRGSWLSLYPRSSIRQIDGVWTGLLWNAGGRQVTLDAIEHQILRPEFAEPRIHFAINCAAVGCPPLSREPYLPEQLEAQFDAAAVRYLGSAHGLVVAGTTLRLSSIFKWFGDDFVSTFADRGPAGRSATDRALLAMVAAYGPPVAQALARQAATRVAHLSYDWSLNDTAAAPR